jgi:8-oxoguanine deaminase
MKTRIDHATVITPRGDQVVVLEDTSVTFEDGVITHVGPSAAFDAQTAGEPLISLGEFRGRPLGAILVRLGKVSREHVVAALERQKAAHGVIGHILLEMGLVTEPDIEHALEIQAGREPAEIIDGRNRLLIPGLINTHHHLFQSLTRCMPAVQSAPLFKWLTTLYPVWRGLDRDALHQAATISIAELLLGGCTTTSDHQYLFPRQRNANIEAVLQAADTLGIRIHASRGSMTLGNSRGGLPPDECTEDEAAVLADSARAIEQFHDPRPMAMRRIDLAPCAPFNISPELLDETRALAAERNVLLHTHVAETLDEERYCLDRFGARPIEFLHKHGWLGKNVYLAHCVQLNADEIALLARTDTAVAHCPSSNMRLGSGMAPIRCLLDAGVRVGLGADGGSSNDCGNLLLEARQALLVQRIRENAGAMTPAEAFHLVLYDATDIALAGAVAQDPLGALLLAQPPRPDRVIVAGKTLVIGGQLTRIDAAKTTADFNQLVRDRFRQ